MYKICSRCILDSNFPGIWFDSQGVCNFCHKYDRKNKQYAITEDSRKHFSHLIHKIQKVGKNAEYDCIIGVSGGRDSTYTLYLLKEWGLNPLAVHFDNNMDSQIAAANIKKACTKLDIDLYTDIVDWEEFKDLQRSFLFASVPSVDIPTDHAFVTVLYRLASTKKIKYVFSGSSFRTEGPGSIEWSLHDDVRFIQDIHKKFGTIPLKNFPIRTLKDVIKWRIEGLREIRPLYYIDYNHEQVDRILTNDLGWKYYGGHHFENIFTRWSFAYLLPKKFHIDKRITDYSVLILSGQLTRDEALHKMQEEIYTLEQERDDRRYITNKLGLTIYEMENILKNPPKRNFDYNHHKLPYRILYYLAAPWRY